MFWIFFSLVGGDCNHDPETQRNEHFCSCVDAAPGANVSEAAVLASIVDSLDSCMPIVCLV